MKLINNPLFRIIGITIIIYFALFHNKENKNSLRNRLSSERIKANAEYIKNQGIYIKENLDKAKEYERLEEQNTTSQPIQHIQENEAK